MATLKDICEYYIDCIGNEGISVSLYSTSRSSIPDYIDLKNFPKTIEDLGQKDISLYTNNFRGANFYIGYPTSVREVKSKNGKSFYKLEPIFLFKLNINNGIMDIETPLINFDVVKTLCGSSGSQIINDVISMEQSLGLYDNSEVFEIDNLIQKLKNITPNWEWKNKEVNLIEIDEGGIFDNAMLVHIEQNAYTQGLVQELRQLSKLTNANIKGTALEILLDQNVNSESDTKYPILEVLPLNEEQRNAVKSALTSPVTIITGPPGTGKSQVIGNIIINAVLNNKKILFASKNNKAVDIIDERINQIGDRPILLRQGSNKYSHNLAKYLLSLLQLNGTAELIEEFDEKYAEYNKIQKQLIELKDTAIKVKNYRNEVDEADQDVTAFRIKQGQKFIDSFEKINLADINHFICEFDKTLTTVNTNKFNLFDQIIWKIVAKKRIKSFETNLKILKDIASKINIDLSNLSEKYDILNINDYYDSIEDCKEQLNQLFKYKEYLRKVHKLQKMPTLEEINCSIFRCNDKVLTLSKRIWQLYLIKQSMNLSKSQRKNLSAFVPLMKEIININEHGDGYLTKLQSGQYTQLLKDCSEMLPCWAVTSLSAKSGKIPFIKNYYDIVVFDEASQCDIASAIPLLYRAKQMVIIGDPKQLSHITNIRLSDEKNLRIKHKFSVEDARFSYVINSLYNIAEGVVNSHEEIISLKEHYRSNCDIINFSNREFYNNSLRIATSVNDLHFFNEIAHPIIWKNVVGESMRPSSGGLLNIQEAQAVVEKLREILIKNSYIGTIGVVSPFRAQVNKIRELIHKDTELISRMNSVNLLINTAHGFQGDERDIIIFSPAVSDNITSGATLFLSKEENI
ncbi:MAG: DNA2/NAM7 family helicase, partial [Candidatus Gastranaerophilales bacterium]|nr:DNA2/NAM7 family helicase [Candidatus Gastranaerophilales bacterium]